MKISSVIFQTGSKMQCLVNSEHSLAGDLYCCMCW